MNVAVVCLTVLLVVVSASPQAPDGAFVVHRRDRKMARHRFAPTQPVSTSFDQFSTAFIRIMYNVSNIQQRTGEITVLCFRLAHAPLIAFPHNPLSR